MDASRENGGVEPAGVRRRWWGRRWFKVVVSLAAVSCLALVVVAEYVLHNARPILRNRIVETLSERFDAPVELDRVDISLFKGIQVEGWGLRIPFGAGTPAASQMHPLIAVQHFAFRTSLKGLLQRSTHVPSVRVEGMEIHIPSARERAGMFGTDEGRKPADPKDLKLKPKVTIVVDELLCRDVKLYVESGQPNRDPLGFEIASLRMENVGRNEAMWYDAQLTNPKPFGAIHATGHFGPWAGRSQATERLPDPGQTPIDGEYTFDHADLNTIRGIGGMLSSTGRFAGVLDRITVDGKTDTPDFSLDISDHPVPLHTEFHAIVDGTNGDTYLQPVHAVLGRSEFTTTGKVVKVRGQGHDIELNVDIPHGRMQDFLRLAVKTNPPVIQGVLTMRTKLNIPPGHERVPIKMAMDGNFRIRDVTFNNPKMQDRMDELSARAQGHPNDAKVVGHDVRPESPSEFTANFRLGHGVMTVSDVRYAIPGALVLLNGVYSMDGKLFEFKGHVRTQATASQMVTGWKSLLLKPVDPFLKKNGAGLELPIEMSGTEGDVHLGLAMHGTDETPSQMLAEVRSREHNKQEMMAARKESAEADAEDARAAKSASLQEAERLHGAAVRHRAEAQERAVAAEKQNVGPGH